MAVSRAYGDYVLEQLGRITPVRARTMFGELGVYAGEHFFALIADDVLYFKVDDTNRPDFEAEGMGPFRPTSGSAPMQYYEVPGDVLEEPERLRSWLEKSLEVARRKHATRGRRRR